MAGRKVAWSLPLSVVGSLSLVPCRRILHARGMKKTMLKVLYISGFSSVVTERDLENHLSEGKVLWCVMIMRLLSLDLREDIIIEGDDASLRNHGMKRKDSYLRASMACLLERGSNGEDARGRGLWPLWSGVMCGCQTFLVPPVAHAARRERAFLDIEAGVAFARCHCDSGPCTCRTS
ncbi:hypothetical protein OPV22_009716 [Ensete ventricosum]|uniref:Uncharacterized protein n=1 Tax=Ensete ventricosum TaxID=4639 RepID=A0AAV8PTF7_ENSVE|nr:hypothetical protein OPV22_009716 [Ensete ventricosum]